MSDARTTMRALIHRTAWLTVTLACSSSLHAQRVIKIDGKPCASCRIELKSLVRLGTPSGPGSLERASNAAILDKRGRFLVTGINVSSFLVFDSLGRYQRNVGRAGQGPGEYGDIAKVIPVHRDTIHVLDNGQGRWTVLDGDFGVRRVVQLPFAPSREAVVLPDGYLVSHSAIYSPVLAGLPLHLVDTAGRRVRSFGSESGMVRSDIGGFDVRLLTSAPGSGNVWSAFAIQYVIEEWNSTDKLVTHLERSVDWFTPQLKPTPHGPDRSKPPIKPTTIAAIHVDSGGLLWVVIAVPDSIPGRGVEKRPNGGWAVTDPEKFQDSILEVIDLRKGTLVGSVRVDYKIQGFAADGLIVASRHRDDGTPFVEIFRARVTR